MGLRKALAFLAPDMSKKAEIAAHGTKNKRRRKNDRKYSRNLFP